MCGIAGFVTTDGQYSPTSLVSMVVGMTDKLAHRGPDGEGVTEAIPIDSGGHAVLGHRRLSIVDIAGGKQPMACPEARVWLTFNGEIYNFPVLREQLIDLGFEFETQSDTEVVLMAYRHFGQDCVKLFNGMFSLAIWDSGKKKLFVARDPYGKKPLYYRHNDAGFQFASEIKAFARFDNKPEITSDVKALEDCTLLRYVPGEQTLYDGILKLEPGTSAYYDPDSNTLSTLQYYQHPDSMPRKHLIDEVKAPSMSVQQQFLVCWGTACRPDSIAMSLSARSCRAVSTRPL